MVACGLLWPPPSTLAGQELLDDSFCNGTTEDVINMAASALLGMPNDARFDAKAAHNVTPASTRHRRRRLGSGRPSLTPSRQEANRVQEAPASVRRSTAASAPVPEAPPQGLWSLPWPRHQPLRGCLPANFDASAPSRPVPSSGFGSPSGPMRVEGNALQVAVVRVDSPSLAKSRKKALEPPVTYQPLSLVGEPRHDGSMRTLSFATFSTCQAQGQARARRRETQRPNTAPANAWGFDFKLGGEVYYDHGIVAE